MIEEKRIKLVKSEFIFKGDEVFLEEHGIVRRVGKAKYSYEESLRQTRERIAQESPYYLEYLDRITDLYPSLGIRMAVHTMIGSMPRDPDGVCSMLEDIGIDHDHSDIVYLCQRYNIENA